MYDGSKQVWKKPLPDGSFAVALYNLGTSEADIAVSWRDLGFSGNALVRDVVARRELGAFDGGYKANLVPPHGSRLLKVSPRE